MWVQVQGTKPIKSCFVIRNVRGHLTVRRTFNETAVEERPRLLRAGRQYQSHRRWCHRKRFDQPLETVVQQQATLVIHLIVDLVEVTNTPHWPHGPSRRCSGPDRRRTHPHREKSANG